MNEQHHTRDTEERGRLSILVPILVPILAAAFVIYLHVAASGTEHAADAPPGCDLLESTHIRHEGNLIFAAKLTSVFKMKKVDLLLSLAGFQLAVSLSAPHEYHRYVIIGAGPGGIQLAHYLDSAGRDYLVLDKVRQQCVLMQNLRMT